jgi:hypothetical protein
MTERVPHADRPTCRHCGHLKSEHNIYGCDHLLHEGPPFPNERCVCATPKGGPR